MRKDNYWATHLVMSYALIGHLVCLGESDDHPKERVFSADTEIVINVIQNITILIFFKLPR
jgi:hypothetical protein